jgi:hypothetical protein
LIDNKIVMFEVFQQTVCIPIGTSCAPLIAICSIIQMKQTS